MLYFKGVKLVLTAACAACLCFVITACNSTSSTDGNPNSNPGDSTLIDPGANALGEQNGIVFATSSHTWKLGNSNVWKDPPAGRRQLNVNNYVGDDTHKMSDTTLYQGVLIREFSLIVKMAAPGTFTCATGDSINLFASYQNAGTVFTSTACSVQVDYMSASGGMAGKILSATLLSPGGKAITFSNAQFRVYKHYGKTGVMPVFATTSDTSFHISAQIDTSSAFELPAGRYFLMDSTPPVGPGSSFGFSNVLNDGTLANDKITLFFQNLSNQVGTYHCGEGVSIYSRLNMEFWLGTYQFTNTYNYQNGSIVASCTVIVKGISGNSSSRGSYQATLVNVNPADTLLLPLTQRTIKIHGEFRH